MNEKDGKIKIWAENIKLEDIQPDETTEETDVTSLIGSRTRIQTVQVRKGDYGPYLYVATEVIGDTGYKATRLFSLKEKEDGSIVWSRKGDLQQFLDKMKAEHPKDLAGKEVVIVLDKNKKYLSFV